MVLINLYRKKALNTKSAYKQNKKEAFIGTSDKIEEFGVKVNIFLK